MDWRSNNNNRLYDPDTNFKRIVESEKLKRVKQASQTGAPLSLTKQQIEDRVARQEIIQQAVKDGTYNDPSKPWNKVHRWVEDGEPRHE